MIPVIINFLVWFVVWVGLSWPVTVGEIITGFIVAAFVSYMTIDVFRSQGTAGRTEAISGFMKLPARIFWFVIYTVVFLWECLRANIDVAYRVLHPDLPIRPGTIRVKTALTSDAGITFLANSITLTPGTTTVDVDKEKGIIYIHWLCVKEVSGEPCRLPAVERFEWILKRIFN